jgi:solute carrier family 13 (sodium-dependent dicarboxylate transporter), member 2/3/5
LGRRGYQRWLLLRSQVNIYYFWEKRWFFVAMLVGFIALQLPTPEGLTYEGQIVLSMSLVATLLFITEPVPLPTVALLIVIGQVLLLGLDPTHVAQSLMTDSVLFIMGSLMLAVAIVKQKLDQRIAWLIVRFTGTNAYWVTFGITSVCGFIAAFIGEHTVAAMMLPVGVRLITLTSADPKKVHNLAAVILFSISYGCSIAGIASPSGGARNAIMIGYWQQLFFNPVDPQSYRFLMDYVTWMIYAFPMFLLRLPFVTAVLFFTFKPEITDMARAIARLRTQVMMQGPLKPSDWLTILIFGTTILGWVFLSPTLGLGTIALAGVSAFLILGLVRWEDVNSGVNWGVVLLYAAAISLGVEMQATGAAQWLASTVVELLRPIGADARPRPPGGHVASHHRGVQYHDRRRRGGGARAHRAQDRQHRRRGSDHLRLRHRHLLVVRLSDAGRPARLHHHLCLGLPQGHRFPQDRAQDDGAVDGFLFVMMAVYWPLLGRLGY